MPASIVVGAQYGSEGKGKIAFEIARTRNASAAVRVGGPNSGHTIVHEGRVRVFRQLPTAAALGTVVSVLPAGSFIDLDVLMREIDDVGASPALLVIDPDAVVITDREKSEEAAAGLGLRIGSTLSGTGAAVARRVARDGTLRYAKDEPALARFLADTVAFQSHLLDEGKRVVIEGTQGFGLSLIHGRNGKYATSRDTTAAAVASEAGIGPLHVDEVALVARAFPIRVAGNSGPLTNELTWAALASNANKDGLVEFTTVTGRVRRVGEFDPEVVIRAIAANSPSAVYLNHVDYVADVTTEEGRDLAERFVSSVESSIGRRVDFIGLARDAIRARSDFAASAV